MANNPVELVLRRLENVVAGPIGSWNALCPAHDDNMNSLSVGEGVDGRALLFCHAGCSLNEVVGAMGIRVRDLFVQRRGRR
jgi:putative DNA primase/helicase